MISEPPKRLRSDPPVAPSGSDRPAGRGPAGCAPGERGGGTASAGGGGPDGRGAGGGWGAGGLPAPPPPPPAPVSLGGAGWGGGAGWVAAWKQPGPAPLRARARGVARGRGRCVGPQKVGDGARATDAGVAACVQEQGRAGGSFPPAAGGPHWRGVRWKPLLGRGVEARAGAAVWTRPACVRRWAPGAGAGARAGARGAQGGLALRMLRQPTAF